MISRGSEITNTAAERVWALVCGMDPNQSRHQGIVILTAFIDDSGSGGDSPWYVLSGVVSTVEKWAEFSNEWDGLLRATPKIDYFKMSEAGAQEGQFSGCTKEQRDRKIYELAELVEKHTIHFVNVLIEQEPYDRILKPLLPKKMSNPYLFALNGIAVAMSSLEVYKGRSEQIECVFDKQQKIGNRAAKLYERIVSMRGSPLPGFDHTHLIKLPIRFEDEKQFLPLQAADLVAWHIRRFWCHGFKGPIYDRLRPPGRAYTGKLREPRLKQLAERFKTWPFR